MLGPNARKCIDKDVKKWQRDRANGKLTNAEILQKARKLNSSYKDSPISLNTLGSVLTWCYQEHRETNPQSAAVYLKESCDIYLRARTRAPLCLWTRLQYCWKVLGLATDAELWKILNTADEIRGKCHDPMIHHVLLPEELLSLSTAQERIHYVVAEYDSLKSFIRKRLVEDLAAYEAERNDLRRFWLQRSLAAVDSVSEDYKKSIVLSLYRARMLVAIGRFANAESECIRGLEMKRPTDPMVDAIPYLMDTSVHFAGEFQATGDTENERVECVKGHLKFLLRLISFRLKGYWDSLGTDKDSYLTSGFGVLVQHYKEANPIVQHALNNALKFFETHGQWDYWVCPMSMCSAGLILSIDELWSHLSIHGYNSFDKPSCEQKCCEMFLWKYQEILLFTLGLRNRELVCNIYPVKHTSFDNLKEAKSKERRDRLSELKAAGDNADESNKLWHQLMKACHISYCEYLVPILRIYHRAKLLDAATEVFTKREICREDMKSVFWASHDESEIRQETEDDVKVDTLQVKCSELDNRYLLYWTEKQNRGYKWFSDTDFPELKEYKFTCFSNAAGDPMCAFNALQAIDTHQQTNAQRLIITDRKVPGSKSALNYAWMTGTRLRSPMVPCVVTLKKPKQEISLIFDLLSRCQHPNILKPLGVWPDSVDPSMGCIILPHIDGAISTISGDELFLEDNNAIVNFSETGFKIFGDIMSGVQYVNTHYVTPFPAGNEVLRHFRLNISPDCIYYIRDVTGEYQIYLGEFTVESPEESDKVNVDELVTYNWNAVGILLNKLCAGQDVDEELTHLIDVLMGPSVKYDDAVWEPGLWTVSEKMIFIREVFWIQRSYQEKRDELDTKQPLGIESFAKKVFPEKVWKDHNMHSDFMFLRNKVLGHQDSIYHNYQGPKEEIGTRKATIVKLLRKEAPGCIIKLVEGIRALKWCILSPFRRSPDETERWHQSMFPAPKQQSSQAAQAPQQPPS